jgi:hypothetical protein
VVDEVVESLEEVVMLHGIFHLILFTASHRVKVWKRMRYGDKDSIGEDGVACSDDDNTKLASTHDGNQIIQLPTLMDAVENMCCNRCGHQSVNWYMNKFSMFCDEALAAIEEEGK